MTGLNLIVLAFFGFLATEGTVEYLLGTAFDKIAKLTPFKWLLMYASAGVGIFLCFNYQLDVVAQLLGGGPTAVGMVLTGIVAGRGANFVADIWSRFVKPA